MERLLEQAEAGVSAPPRAEVASKTDDFAAMLHYELGVVGAERNRIQCPALDLPRRRNAYRQVDLPEAGSPRSDAVQRAHEDDLVGLAFSGGGIRSATFNLGILQGLADLRLLRLFDYLSTVSGGGYIGSWFQAWITATDLATVES